MGGNHDDAFEVQIVNRREPNSTPPLSRVNRQ